MNSLQKTGRLFYGLGMLAYGIQQIVIRDFRPQILPGFPAWIHHYSFFPIVTGIVMVLAGLAITGLIGIELGLREKITFYAGVYFLLLIFVSQIPYLLFVYPHKLSHLGSWGDALKELAFCGASFVMLATFPHEPATRGYKADPYQHYKDKLVTMGKIFFCTTIILYGCNHFAYDLSFMVPKWFGMPAFWSYFGGAALIGAGTALLLNIFIRPVALLLALMLFLWFLFLHVPGAIAHPSAGHGNAVVSAFDALLFCGVALVLSEENRKRVVL